MISSEEDFIDRTTPTGVDASVLNSVPSPNPYILKSNLTATTVDSPFGKLEGNSSYVFRASELEPEIAAGGGGSVKIVDSRNFPVAKTIASSIVTLKPGALRELHWHPNVSIEHNLFIDPQPAPTNNALSGRRMALLPLRHRPRHRLRRQRTSHVPLPIQYHPN